jgi:hypothetical protein
MRAPAFLAALLTTALAAVLPTVPPVILAVEDARAQTIGPVDPGAPVDVSAPKGVTINGVSNVRVRATPGASQGYMVPDGAGGYVNYAPGPPLPPQSPARSDAEEVRLYARELAAQVTGGMSGDMPLTGVVSVPSAFVDQDTRASSSFGRLMGEQMIYELNSRGYPVKEARGTAPIRMAKGRKAPAEALAVLAGTYYVDRDNLFVNARLVEPSGRVLRSGSVLVPMTPTLRRMLGLPDPAPYGWRPTLPTLIGSRDVNDPPCIGAGMGARPVISYSPSPTPVKKWRSAKKLAKRRAKTPCPPGCEPIDTAAKTPAKQPATPAPATQPAAPPPAMQPVTPQPVLQPSQPTGPPAVK